MSVPLMLSGRVRNSLRPATSAKVNRSSFSEGLLAAVLPTAFASFTDSTNNIWTMGALAGSAFPTLTAGQNGYACQFDTNGTSWYTSTLNMPTTSMTVLFIAKPGDASGHGDFFGADMINGNGDAMWIGYPDGSSGHILGSFGTRSGGTNGLKYTYPTGYLNSFHSVCFRAGTLGTQLWSDGVLVASNATSITRTSTTGIRLGEIDINGTFFTFNGAVESLFLYNRELSNSEISSWMSEPYQMFSTIGAVAIPQSPPFILPPRPLRVQRPRSRTLDD